MNDLPKRANDPVEVLPYDPAWQDLFRTLHAQLRAVLPSSARIAHIGSTAVSGLCAKPVIDILVGAPSHDAIGPHLPALCALGYEHVTGPQSQIAGREFLVLWRDGIRTAHLHAVAYRSPFWDEHIAFRDALRRLPALRERYARLKQALADAYRHDRAAYTDAKAAFIREALHAPHG